MEFKHIEEVFSVLHESKLKYIIRASLACGVMITAVALSGCSGSEKAVQANAPVMSNPELRSKASAVISSSTVTSSDSVSSSASTVSSDTRGVTSQESSSLNSTASKPSSNTTSTKPTSTKPTSTVTKPASTAPKPASKPTSTAPASKPASKPTSTAPAPKPTSTAPVDNGSFSAKYYGATYGCDDKSQYNTVLERANAVKGSSKYNRTYDAFKGDADGFKAATGVDYSEEWLDIASIRGYFGQSGRGSASAGSAYDYFTGANSMCGDKAKALEAALHCAGYNARLAVGTRAGGPHMWVQVNMGGSWYNLTETISTSLNPGYTLSSTGYNL